MLVAPIPYWVILAGYISGGVLRGLIVGLIVTVIAMFFIGLPSIYSPFIVISIVILTSVLFSLGGFLNGMFANNFDDIFHHTHLCPDPADLPRGSVLFH